MDYMKKHQREWLDAYLADKKNDVAAYDSLLRLCERFAHRHGFSKRTPCFTKEPAAELLETRNEFAQKFWGEYGGYTRREILNVDETSVYYDTPPNRIWAVKGGSAKINRTQKHSARLTAVLTVRADGKKLPLLFIVRGTPGGTIETKELPNYPKGHYYAVQQNAWMDAQVWKRYDEECLAYQIEGPSVLLLDNFDAYVSEEGQQLVSEAACCAVCPLSANATSVCQPLDVGGMGPLKSRLRTHWLKEKTRATTAAEKRRAMIERTIKAYEALDASTIVGSFEEAIPQIVSV